VGPKASLDVMERAKFLVPTGNRTPTPQSSSLVAIPAKLTWLPQFYHLPYIYESVTCNVMVNYILT
jgi:hypothetical protein